MLGRLYAEIFFMLVMAKKEKCVRRIKKAKTPEERYYWARKGYDCIVWHENFYLCEIGIG